MSTASDLDTIAEEAFVEKLVAALDAREPGAGTRMLAVRNDARSRRGIAASLRAERERQGLTPADIDARLDAKPGTTQAIESGLADPYLSTLQRYARALGGRLVADIEMPEEQS